MNQWAFVAAAYAITAIGTMVVSLLSYRAMRVSECQAEKLAQRV
nr:hypothetical protein [Sphingomonas sp. CDS-1]